MVKRTLFSRVLLAVIKFLAIFAILAVCALILWRVFFSTIVPGDMKTVIPTGGLVQVYREQGKDTEVFYQKQYTTVTTEKETSFVVNTGTESVKVTTGATRGLVGVPETRFYPAAKEVQVVFRYNAGLLEKLAETYALEEVPDKSGDYLDFSVVVKYKNGKEERHTLTASRRTETSVYTYYRLAFSGVETGEDVESVFLDVYYRERVYYNLPAYATLCLYSYDVNNEPDRLTSRDCRVLEEALDAGNN